MTENVTMHRQKTGHDRQFTIHRQKTGHDRQFTMHRQKNQNMTDNSPCTAKNRT